MANAELQSIHSNAMMYCAGAAARVAWVRVLVKVTNRVAHDDKCVWAQGEGDLVLVCAPVPHKIVDAEHADDLAGCQSRVLVQPRRRNSLAHNNDSCAWQQLTRHVSPVGLRAQRTASWISRPW